MLCPCFKPFKLPGIKIVLHNLRSLLLPRPSITHRASLGTLAGSTKLLWQILDWNLLDELVPICATQNVNLLDSHLIQPRLNDRPDGAESPWRIDDIKLAHRLGVPILANRRSLHNVILDTIEVGKRDATQV